MKILAKDWPHFIIQSMADGVITVNGRLKITDFNKAAEELMGYTREEVLGKFCGDVLRSTLCGAECPLRKAMNSGEAVPREAVLHNRFGQNIEVVLAASALRDDQGNLLGGVETFRDIGPFKLLEKERRYLVGMFAHDLKSPMVSISGLLNRLRQGKVGKLSQDQARYIEIIYHDIQGLEKLIVTFLDYARLDLHIINPMPSAIQVEQECQEVINRLQPQAEAKEIAIEAKYPQEVIVIQADPILLQRALGNLLENAIKYSPPKSKVALAVQVIEKGVEFSVKDQGPGIAPQDQPHLFELLYRGKSARAETGLGLGLTIVKRIIDAHGGRLWVESEEGRGATFSFILPHMVVQ